MTEERHLRLRRTGLGVAVVAVAVAGFGVVAARDHTAPVTTAPAPASTADQQIAAASTVVQAPVLAVDALAQIAVADEHPGGYDRTRFGYAGDLDGDGCDTRSEVLQRDSLTPAQIDPVGCFVLAGDWYSPYDGLNCQDPAAVEIDHVVAFKEAHDSGAWAWSDEQLVAFGNDIDDPRALRAVTAAVNQAKGDADPSNWLPADPAYLCPYLADWIAIKARWNLTMDQSEHGRIGNLVNDSCPGLALEPLTTTASSS